MAEVVVATLNVNFAEDSTATQGVLKLEIDDREEGLNAGDTSFQPGDTVGFWLFRDSNVNLITTTPISTSGGVTSVGSASKEIDEYITFSNTDSGSLDYPPSGSVSLEWAGRCYRIAGTVVTTTTVLPERTRSQLAMPDNTQVAGVLRARYTTNGSLWRLQSVPNDIEEVLLFAIGQID